MLVVFLFTSEEKKTSLDVVVFSNLWILKVFFFGESLLITFNMFNKKQAKLILVW